MMKTQLLRVALIFSFLGTSILAVAQGGSGTTGGAGGAPGQSPQAISGIGKDAKTDALRNQGQSGDYLQGKVTVAGNPMIWDPIPVSVFCDGKSRAQVYADAKGRFQFNSTSLIGPVPLKPGEVQLTAQYVGCSVRAELAGYRSSSLVIVNRSLADDPNIGNVELTREERATGTALSTTSTSAPKEAVKAFEKARQEALEQKMDKARGDLQKALQIDPQFAEAWYQLGKIERKTSSQDAKNSFMKAVAADPQYVPTYEQLAELAAVDAKWKEAADNIDHALQLDPTGTPQVWYFDAVAKLNTGRPGEAETSAQKSLAMDPAHMAPNTEQLLAVILAGRHDYPGALEHLRHCLTYMPPGPNADVVKQQAAALQHVLEASK
jgi:tetratricopeptide (TPR) repeat protein